ncbi:uncharacterized protein LOC128127731 [Lactuca sativa]|uniref:uncharacterized protein LOC128127731 n=1 Tax=Lactuca sativa TaxID=4236 RepID=UPI0022AF2FC0|nr:uncharacterized protein LOC128127731 [Lactuca sativa]
MTSFSHLLGSSTKIPMLILEYYDQWADRMQDYLNGLDEDLWNCISGEINPPATVQSIGASSSSSENKSSDSKGNFENKNRVDEKLKEVKKDSKSKMEKMEKMLKEMKNPSHGAMFAKMEEDSDEEQTYEVRGQCFVSKSNDKSPMTTKIRILKKIENSTSNSESNFVDIENNSDNISEISDLEDVDFSQLSVINVANSFKGKDKCEDLLVKIDTDQPSTSKVCDMEFVEIHDSQTDDSDNEEESTNSKTNKSSKEVEIPRVVVDQVYMDLQEFE